MCVVCACQFDNFGFALSFINYQLLDVSVSALEDLWEEADESDTGSQDSDTAEPMVVE